MCAVELSWNLENFSTADIQQSTINNAQQRTENTKINLLVTK